MMSIFLWLFVPTLLNAAEPVKLGDWQIDGYQRCFNAFRNYSETKVMAFPVGTNKSVLFLPAGDDGVIVYPSGEPAFKSPLTKLKWKNGPFYRLYFYTPGTQSRYWEYIVTYDGVNLKEPIKESVDAKKIFFGSRTNVLDLVDHGIKIEELHLSLSELPAVQRKAATVDEKPLLAELERLIKKMDAQVDYKYSTRDFDMSFTEVCRAISPEGKQLLQDLRTRLNQKPDIRTMIHVDPVNSNHGSSR